MDGGWWLPHDRADEPETHNAAGRARGQVSALPARHGQRRRARRQDQAGQTTGSCSPAFVWGEGRLPPRPATAPPRGPRCRALEDAVGGGPRCSAPALTEHRRLRRKGDCQLLARRGLKRGGGRGGGQRRARGPHKATKATRLQATTWSRAERRQRAPCIGGMRISASHSIP